MSGRLDNARSRDNSDEDLAGQITDQAAAIASYDGQIAAKRAEVADLVEKFGKSEFSNLRTLIAKGIKRKNLTDGTAELEETIMEALSCTAIDEALEILDVSEEDELRARRQGLEADLARIMAERDKAGQEHAVAHSTFSQMTGSDETACLIQEREMAVVELIDQITDYMRIRAGEKSLNWALTRYRQANKGPMLEAAGRFFARITGGRYPELITQPGDKGDVLVARETDGNLKTVNALSEGTRHQLFLALRMAGYLEIARSRQAPPLILDDILSSSDDARTGAMLEALSDLAEEVQVIVLTHHAHVLQIAEKAVQGRHAVVRLDVA